MENERNSTRVKVLDRRLASAANHLKEASLAAEALVRDLGDFQKSVGGKVKSLKDKLRVLEQELNDVNTKLDSLPRIEHGNLKVRQVELTKQISDLKPRALGFERFQLKLDEAIAIDRALPNGAMSELLNQSKQANARIADALKALEER